MTEENEAVKELPKGWILVKLSEIASIKGGLTKGKKRKDTDCLRQVPYLRVANVQRGFLDLKEVSLIEATEDEIEELMLVPGDVLFNEGGDRDKLGRGWIWAGELSECIHQNHVFRARPYTADLQPKLVSWYGNTFGQKYFIGEGKQTTNLASINLTKLSNFLIPLAPAAEQLRILEKIEELVSELDQGIENLKTAQKQLKVYRQAVLKWAFEGKLTEQWRQQAQQQGTLKTGEELLAQIKAERENRYQQQVAEWEAAVKTWEANDKPGKKPSKPNKPKDLLPLTSAELAELPQHPNGWCWGKLGDLTLGVEYGTAAKSKKEGKVAVLRMGNIQNCIFDWSDLVFTDDREEIEKYSLQKGDVLFNRTNSPELVGKTAIYQGERPAVFAGYLIRVNQITEIVLPKYLNYFLNSRVAKKHGNTVKTDGVNQSNINGEKLINYPFPYASLDEQEQVVQEIESRLSNCDQLENAIAENLQKAEALRQSILKKAFEGRLVPQDPNDEPAEKLLERIRVEKMK